MNATLFPSERPNLAPEDYPIPIEKLSLFPRLTRATFAATFGEQAPLWDPARRIQRWFDSSHALKPVAELVTYTYWERVSGGAVLKSFQITAGEASTPNLPGKYDYPKWDPAPTGIRIVGPAGGSPISVFTVCTPDEAQQLAEELGAEGWQERVPGFPYSYEIPPTEDRRVYEITGQSGVAVNAGLLLKQKYANGVGAPGSWASTKPPQWISEAQPTGEHDDRPEIPMPIYPLLPTEELKLRFMAASPLVYLKSSAPSVGSSDEVLEVVTRIEDKLTKIANALSISL